MQQRLTVRQRRIRARCSAMQVPMPLVPCTASDQTPPSQSPAARNSAPSESAARSELPWGCPEPFASAHVTGPEAIPDLQQAIVDATLQGDHGAQPLRGANAYNAPAETTQ